MDALPCFRYTPRCYGGHAMSAWTFAVFVFIAMCVAAWTGRRLQQALPKTFTEDATEGHVKALLGMFSMMTAVVLGFVTADAKSSFDSASKIVSDTAVRLVSIDRVLADFGEDGEQIRVRLKRAAEEWIERINSPAGDANSDLQAVKRAEELESFVENIRKLNPTSEYEAEEQGRAVQLALEIVYDRWVLRTDRASSTPTVFLIVLLSWMGLEFFIVGMFASRSAAFTITTFLAAIMVASAFFLVLDLEEPTTGTIRVQTDTLERAVAIMGQ